MNNMNQNRNMMCSNRSGMPCQKSHAGMPYQNSHSCMKPAGKCQCNENPGCSGSSAGNDPLLGMPIAMGYVPWQQWSHTYELCEGLNQGTIFPCLDLPFYGCIPQGYYQRKGGRA